MSLRATTTAAGAPLPMVEVERPGQPMRPSGSRVPVRPQPQRPAQPAAAATATHTSPAPAAAPSSARLDHICVAVSDVSEMADFLTLAGGRVCEAFLTPVYLSSTWEFANTAELQVIAPVESFSVKRAGLAPAERPTTTKAFWNGISSPAAAASTSAAAAAVSSHAVPAPSPAGVPPPTLLYSSPSSSPSPSGRVTFLQRYLRRHGPSIHHVAFLVPSLTEARARFQSFGYTVYGWSARDPLWKECFLAPKQSLGCVIQIAEAANLQADMQWTTSSAALSQTHLTPVVKRHIARMSAGEERWEAAPPPQPRAASHLRANAASAVASSSSSDADAPAPAADVASPSHAASPSLPPRLSLLGLRLRCASEHKARRQWGDMLQASSCSESVDPRTGVRTLCFRWHNAPMYIAVDLERPPPGWRAEREAAAAAAAVEAKPGRAGVEDRDAGQWDGPKWLEFHAAEDSGASRVPSEAALDEMGLELCKEPTAADSPTTLQPAQKRRSRSRSPASPSPRPAPRRSHAAAGGAASASPNATVFAPTYRALPLDPRVVRSAFVAISQPLPLPTPATAEVAHSLRPLSAQEIKAKL